MSRHNRTTDGGGNKIEPDRMARAPKKIKSDQQVVKVMVILPAEDARAIDAEAQRLSETDPYRRVITRSDVIRALVREGLEARKKE